MNTSTLPRSIPYVMLDKDVRQMPVPAVAAFASRISGGVVTPPLGINSTTGVAGLTLGGGFGWLMRRHGLGRVRQKQVGDIT